ncbi:ribokinase [Bacillus lacus]|uniref:Ribokinase n=1 Tax=Metabacillus lacus TaxID=1983721 RepID=A0A7X2IXX8_9BACI|nr:ribokinase [Metabacillus lacus]MRX71649.1 ribokinase [Metabacillus lacus]
MGITVLGSYNVDLMSRSPHLPAPGETVLGGPFQLGPGGKGCNQATAAARLGCAVRFMTKVGNDSFRELAEKTFRSENFPIEYLLISDKGQTGCALIVVDQEGENSIVVAPGANMDYLQEDMDAIEASVAGSSLLLLQLEISMEANKKAIEVAQAYDIPVLLNPAPYRDFDKSLLKHVTYLTPNETEAESMTGINLRIESDFLEAAKVLYEMGASHVMITLGKKGCYLYSGGQAGELLPGFQVKAVDTAGAGDCFNGAFAAAILAGKSVSEAALQGNAAAALSVTKVGTAPSMPNSTELQAFLEVIRGFQ